MSFLFDGFQKIRGKSTEKVDASIKLKRLDICGKCPKLLKTGNCGECGCFVNYKTDYKDERCPLNKW